MPPRHVALLRAVNVGGHNKLPMKSLAALFEDLGATDVRTYIQSGNVVYTAPASVAKTLGARVEKALHSKLAVNSPVITRTASEFARIISSAPRQVTTADPARANVAFLSEKPAPAKAKAFDPPAAPGEWYALHAREIYLHFPEGLAKTKLTNAFFDKALGVKSTVRNWRTVLKLADMLDA